MYEYKAKCIKVVDGDTVDLDVDLGLDIHFNIRVRLSGINAPELHSPDTNIRAAAATSRDYLLTLLASNEFMIKTEKDKKEKYGRYLARIVFADGTCANDKMIAGGYAKLYS